MPSQLLDAVNVVARAVRDVGGRALLVGGCVRDALIGEEPKDYDIEVFSLPPERLIGILSDRFELDLVGSSFGVVKLRHLDIDIAVPRRETKLGLGHKAFETECDPFLSVRDAAARRDFTVNAIYRDPLTGEIVDPWGGQSDLQRKVMRHVSDHFREDPLRVLRGMQFAARFDLVPAEAATWRCSNVAEMGGPIGDVASHCFYVAEFMFGKKIKKVAAVYYPKTMKIKAEDGAYIKFFFEDGTQGSVNCAFSELRGGLAGTLTNLGYEVYGDKAAMRGYGTMFQLSGYADEPIKMRLEIDDGKNVSAVKPKSIQNIYSALIEGHAKSVIAGKPLDADDAIHNLALCAAAHQSAANGGKTVTVRG